MSKLLDLFDDLTGVVLDYALSTPPSAKWLMCFGQALEEGDATTARLRAKLLADGSPYGADGTGNPRVPDARGRVSAGKDDMGGVAAGRLTAGVSGVAGATLGADGGDQRAHGHTHTGSGQTGNAGAHSHSGSGTTSGGGDHVHSYEDQYRTVDGGTASTVLASGTNRALQTSYSTKSTAWAGNHSHTYSFNTSNANDHSHSYSFTTSLSGDGVSQNVQPTIVLNKIIRL